VYIIPCQSNNNQTRSNPGPVLWISFLNMAPKKITKKNSKKKVAKKTVTKKPVKKSAKTGKKVAPKGGKKSGKKVSKKAKKVAAPPSGKIDAPRGEKMTASELTQNIVNLTGVTRKEAKASLEAFRTIGAFEMKKRGVFMFPGMAKFTTKKKPARAAKKGINPFTKEPCVFKARPASTVVKARCVGALKASVA